MCIRVGSHSCIQLWEVTLIVGFLCITELGSNTHTHTKYIPHCLCAYDFISQLHNPETKPWLDTRLSSGIMLRILIDCNFEVGGWVNTDGATWLHSNCRSSCHKPFVCINGWEVLAIWCIHLPTDRRRSGSHVQTRERSIYTWVSIWF